MAFYSTFYTVKLNFLTYTLQSQNYKALAHMFSGFCTSRKIQNLQYNIHNQPSPEYIKIWEAFLGVAHSQIHIVVGRNCKEISFVDGGKKFCKNDVFVENVAFCGKRNLPKQSVIFYSPNASLKVSSQQKALFDAGLDAGFSFKD